MFTQHPTLLIGPSDWDETHAPQAEFERRIAALWDAHPQAAHAIVFGSASRHAELAYLTHFVPKLEPGIALLARDGAHRLLFGGGPNMIGAMQPLTFIADMAPLGALGKLIAGWRAPLLIGGDAMAGAVRKTVDDATGSTAQDATAAVQQMMRRKSPTELAAIRAACVLLDRAIATIRDAFLAGASAAAAVLAGERTAIAAGAQDVRTLFSLDGGRTLRPFEAPSDIRIDPLQVHVATRTRNYWAEGFCSFSERPDDTAAQAIVLLNAALATVKDGRRIADIADAVASMASLRTHPVTETAFAAPIGLALDAAHDDDDPFHAGEIYSLRVGLTDGSDRHAIVSAMIAVRDDGNEVLWRSGIA